MNITIIALGSRGDVLPYAALGRALHEAGHGVRFATFTSFEPLIAARGLSFHPVRGDAQAIMLGSGGQALARSGQSVVRSDQQLLPRLPPGVEGSRYLRATKRSVVQHPAVLTRERDTLRHALVDDVVTDLRQPVNVGLTRPIVTALDRIVKQPPNAVAIVGIVLGGVDPTLGRNAVCPSRAVLEAETLDVVAQLGKRRCCRGSG